MIPAPPPRSPSIGFIYVPPFRVQGYSIAGEETMIQVPELDTCFDIGRCPRSAVACKFVALSHGHMDHAAGLAYYFSQRVFQGMDPGHVLCHPALEKPIRNVMTGWIDLEAQRTPFELTTMAHEAEVEIKNHTYLRAFETKHTVPSLGFVVIERRSKLLAHLVGLPQEKLVAMKEKGEQITQMLQIPLLAFSGDTAMGPHFDRDDVLGARILIVECTFLETGHRDRAAIGKHLHLDDILELLERSSAESVILTHLSRRTHIGAAREELDRVVPARHRDRVLLLMDGRANRERYQKQEHAALENEAKAD